jgi:putative BNR repeat neuraminidase
MASRPRRATGGAKEHHLVHTATVRLAAVYLTMLLAGGAGPTGGGGASGSACLNPRAPAPSGADWVNGTLSDINDNGAWTWYSDERAVIDRAKGKLIVTSDANALGPGGSIRDGNVDTVIWDLATRMGTRIALGDLKPDDHNVAGLLVRPDGNYLAMYAGHDQDCRSYWRSYVDGAWTAARSFDWQPLGCDLSANTKVTYSNPWNMAAENKIYSFVRSIGTSPNVLVSTDQGMTWRYAGRLTSTPKMGYVAGYYKFWGNGVDRIDFVGTEAHPRDFDNSLYHGYFQGGQSYDSTGRMVDSSLSDSTQPQITAFTRVFSTGATVNGVRLHHAWNGDIQRYDDGSIAIIGMARAGTNADSPDHRLLYARWNGRAWKLTYLAKAGPTLYPGEQDYVGLGALHPDDPRTIYISTTIDPRNDTTHLGKHEIFQGTTCDNGATWHWTPITANSTHDNLRPIVPKWDPHHTALLWLRGTYTTAQQYNMAVVGIISNP